jgi:hypothetical protein
MFIDSPDRSTLRQGDIISDVLFPLPRLNSSFTFLGRFRERVKDEVYLDALTETYNKNNWLIAHVQSQFSYCAVLSQCCDVSISKDRPPPSFVLCRMLPVPDALRRGDFQTLRDNIDPYGADVTQKPFFRLFYIEHEKGLAHDFIVDYAQVMTVAWKDYDQMLQKKTLQMDDISRAKFRVKAGASLGRPAKEDVDAGLADPWSPVPASAPSFLNRLSRAARVLAGIE